MKDKNIKRTLASPIEALGLSRENVEIFPIVSKWNNNRCFRIKSNKVDVFLKRWATEDQTIRMQQELRISSILRENNFEEAILPGAISPIPDKDNFHWTIYPFWNNSALSKTSDFSTILPSVVSIASKLHSIRYPDNQNKQIRFKYLIQDSDIIFKNGFLLGGEDFRVIEKLITKANFTYLSEIIDLPKSIIHGDFNFDNMLYTDYGIKLIDFEFSRIDIRIIDIIALQFALRDQRGEFLLNYLDSWKSLLNLYFSKNILLQKEEKQHFLLLSLMYCFLIFRDTTLSNHGSAQAFNLLMNYAYFHFNDLSAYLP